MIKVQNNLRRLVCFLLVALASFVFVNSASAVVLGISGNKFTLDGQAKFLVISAYFDGMDSPNPSADLDYLKSAGFDGIRIFPNWWENVRPLTSDSDPLITGNGNLDQSKLNKLISIVDGANSRGMIVDISFAREVVDGNCNDSNYNPNVLCKSDFKRGVVEVAKALRNKTNVFYDLSNEHDITGFPSTDVIELKGMIESAVGTSSILSVSSVEDGPGSVAIANGFPMDLVSVHFACGSPNSGCELDANIPSTLTPGKPTYIGEPNNTNTVGSYTAQDLIDAVVNAKTVGVAAWTFHTDAGWYLNGTSLQSQLNSSQETGFISRYYQAVQNATWGSGGSGTVPPPSTGACINPAPNPSTVPDMRSVVQGVATAHPNWLQDVCNSYDFIDEVVKQLRAGTGGTRWAFEAKRANLSDPWQEGIAYYYGSGTAPTAGTMSQYEVFAVDIVHQYCGVAGGGTNTADWNVADWPYKSPNLVEVAYLYPRNAGGSLPSPQLCTGVPPPVPPPAPTGPPTITGINPTRAVVGQQVEIYGTNLVEDVKLESSNGQFYTTVGVADNQRTTVSFNVPNVSAGIYKVSVTGPNGSATSPQDLEVISGGSGFPPPIAIGIPSEGLPSDLGQLIEAIFSWSLSLIGLVIFVRFFYAGFLWFTAAGNTTRTGQAMEIMKHAVYGALILFSAWLILNTINPDLVKGGLTLPGLGSGQSTTPTTGTATCNNGVCSNGVGPCQTADQCQTTGTATCNNGVCSNGVGPCQNASQCQTTTSGGGGGGGSATCPAPTTSATLCASVNQNTVLGILNKYPTTNAGITEAIVEVKGVYPNAYVIPHDTGTRVLDKIDFGGGMIVDVMVNAGATNASWGWIEECLCGG